MKIVMKYFHDHKLSISKKKTKLMVAHNYEGEITFIGDFQENPLTIELVSGFKYLGIRFNSRPYKLFSDFHNADSYP